MYDFSADAVYSEYENRGKWVKSYKYFCGVFAIGFVAIIMFNMTKFVESFYMAPSTCYYFAGNVLLFSFEVFIMFLQTKAIQKTDIDLQDNNVYLNKINVIIVPAWLGFGAIYFLRNLTIALYVGISGAIGSILLLYLAKQVKIIFEDDTSKLELGLFLH